MNFYQWIYIDGILITILEFIAILIIIIIMIIIIKVIIIFGNFGKYAISDRHLICLSPGLYVCLSTRPSVCLLEILREKLFSWLSQDMPDMEQGTFCNICLQTVPCIARLFHIHQTMRGRGLRSRSASCYDMSTTKKTFIGMCVINLSEEECFC